MRFISEAARQPANTLKDIVIELWTSLGFAIAQSTKVFQSQTLFFNSLCEQTTSLTYLFCWQYYSLSEINTSLINVSYLFKPPPCPLRPPKFKWIPWAFITCRSFTVWLLQPRPPNKILHKFKRWKSWRLTIVSHKLSCNQALHYKGNRIVLIFG